MNRTGRHLISVSLIFGAGFLMPLKDQAYALFGVGDVTFTTITADIPAVARWAEEKVSWAKQLASLETQISKATEMVNQAKLLKKTTDELLEIAGDPSKLVEDILDDSWKGYEPLEDLLDMPTVSELLSKYSDVSMFKKEFEHIKADPIKETVKIVGEKVKRDVNRYREIKTAEVLEVRLEEAIKTQKEVMEEEMDFQERTLREMEDDDLTENEIHLRKVALEASQARVEAASHQVNMARYDLQNQRQKIAIEERKVAIAKREEISIFKKEIKTKVNKAISASWPWD